MAKQRVAGSPEQVGACQLAKPGFDVQPVQAVTTVDAKVKNRATHQSKHAQKQWQIEAVPNRQMKLRRCLSQHGR